MCKSEKPIVKVTGQDTNVFVTLAICTSALKKADLKDKAKEMTVKVFNAGSYPEALSIMSEYCDLI